MKIGSPGKRLRNATLTNLHNKVLIGVRALHRSYDRKHEEDCCKIATHSGRQREREWWANKVFVIPIPKANSNGVELSAIQVTLSVDLGGGK